MGHRALRDVCVAIRTVIGAILQKVVQTSNSVNKCQTSLKRLKKPTHKDNHKKVENLTVMVRHERPRLGGERPRMGDERQKTRDERPMMGDKRLEAKRPMMGDKRRETRDKRPKMGDERRETKVGDKR